MLRTAAILVVVVALVSTGHAKDKSCKLTLQTDLVPSVEPLVLEVNKIRQKIEQLEIIRPEVEDKDGIIYVSEDKSLLLACTGKGNYNKGSHSQTAYAKCSNGQLTIDGKKANKNNLACSNSVAWSWLRVSEDKCGEGDNTGTKVQLGFELTDLEPKTWFPLVDVCHNLDRSVSYYSAHELYGGSLKGAVKSSERRSFTRGPKPLFTAVNPNSVYTQKGQKKAFDKILGEDENKLYINTTVYLARGHLSPDADFIYNSGQLMTYYYVNVAPQWQTFNAGNWLAIENAVRDLAVKEDDTLNVYTGTYGILKLKNSKGDERMMYLEPTKKLIPVPGVYWKIVRHPVKKSCTVAIGHNNVFLTEPPTPICKTAQADGWPTLTNLAKGYVYYCDYESFVETVTYAPKLDCKDLFEFPQLPSSGKTE